MEAVARPASYRGGGGGLHSRRDVPSTDGTELLLTETNVEVEARKASCCCCSCDRGDSQRKPILFFPPAEPGGDQMLGLEWGAWQEVNETQPLGVGSWDNETGLLAKSQSGNALPLGKQRNFQYC